MSSAGGSLSLYDLSFFDETDFVTVFTAYFDASENGGVFTVGMLLFRKRNIRPFETRWRLMKTTYQIPYFHMAECNANKGVFGHLSEEECIQCAAMAIDAVATYASKGGTWSINIKDFDEIIGKKGYLPSPLAACTFPAMADAMNWAKTNDHNPPPRIFYVFESGDADQGDIDNMLRAIAENAPRRERFRYEDHAFLPKEGSLPTQGADIIAWHGSKHHRRRLEGNSRLRGDFNALVNRLKITDGLHSREKLQRVSEVANRHTEEFGPELAQLALMMNRSNKRRTMEKIRGIVLKDRDG